MTAPRGEHFAETRAVDWRAIAQQLAAALASCTVPGPKVGEERWAALQAYQDAQYDGDER
jgi:hypothetical protein